MKVDAFQQSQNQANVQASNLTHKPTNEFPEILLAKISRPPFQSAHDPFGDFSKSVSTDTIDSKILLGTTSDKAPTVSDVLHQHPALSDQKWDIIFNQQNRNKPYTKISPGTKIYLDPRNGELSWKPFRSNDFENIALLKLADHSSQLEGKISLGILSEETPTVSHLLKQHPDFAGKTWEILGDSANQNKDFNRIKRGETILFDPQTKEISWQFMPERIEPKTSIAAAAFENIAPEKLSTSPAITEDKLVKIGTIDDETPTVSHLFKNNPDFSEEYWNIIFNDQNRQKPFASIRPGTDIYINPQTNELVWGNIPENQVITAANTAEEKLTQPVETVHQPAESLSARLAKAVQPYLGRSYDEINCYGLVVRGLNRMGVRYLGDGGIRDRLIKMAVDKGLPPNAYFNGEGIIEATGKQIYSKTIYRVRDAEQQAGKVLKEMVPKLAEGSILSFSTPTRGHTGIISRQNDTWTFINSGEMDNQIDSSVNTKGVGEEVLTEEIKNWFELAAANKQSLVITLGKLEKDKLQTAMKDTAPRIPKTL